MRYETNRGTVIDRHQNSKEEFYGGLKKSENKYFQKGFSLNKKR